MARFYSFRRAAALRKKGTITLLILCLMSCASLPEECRQPYAYSIPHCPPKKRLPQTAKECESIGGVSIIRDGRYTECINSDQVRDLLRNL